MLYRPFTALLLAVSLTAPVLAETEAPWGRAQGIEKEYRKQKVVYDTTVSSVRALNGVLDRASYLSQLNGADPFDNKIVIMLHGNEIPFFAIKNHAQYRELMQRAQSLTVGGIIEFRMCQAAARMHGFQPRDFHGFIKLVPMADAEIVELQHQGYAYMR